MLVPRTPVEGATMFRRDVSLTIKERLREPRRFMQVITGPRQTGKTTAIKQAIKAAGPPFRAASADGLSVKGPD